MSAARLLLTGFILWGRAWAGELPLEQESVSQWIRELGAVEFRVREQADESLRRAGEAAREQMEKAQNAPDPEVRLRVLAMLADLRWGITGAWPAELATEVRGYEALPLPGREELARRLLKTLRADAALFLMTRLRAGDAAEQQMLLAVTRELDDAAVAQQVLVCVRGDDEARIPGLMVWAQRRAGNVVEALRILAARQLDPTAIPALLEEAVKELVGDVQRQMFQQVATKADALLEVIRTDARLCYLRAEAAAGLAQPQEAQRFRMRGLNLAGATPASRDATAEMLWNLNREDLARREWETAFEAGDADDHLVVRAFLQLGNVYTKREQWAAAVDAYEAGLRGYRQLAARGVPVVFTTGTEGELEQRLTDLRAKAQAAANRQCGTPLEALCAAPGKEGELLQQAWQFFERDEPDLALKVCGHFLATQPVERWAAAARYLMGLTHFRLGEWAAAQTIFAEQLGAAGGANSNAPPTGLDRLLECCRLQKRYPLDVPRPPRAKGADWVALGDTLFTARRFAEAAKIYQKTWESDPESEAGAYGRLQEGRCYNQLQRYQAALRCYRLVATEWPESPYAPEALLRAGVIWTGPLNNAERGVRQNRLIMSRYPKSPLAERAHYYVAASIQWAERWDEALREYQLFLVTYPQSDFRPYIEKEILPQIKKHLEGAQDKF